MRIDPRKAKVFIEEKTTDFQEALRRYPHLREYVQKISAELGTPEWKVELTRDLREIKYPNIIYPVGDPIFIHIYRKPGESIKYYAIEPQLTAKEKEIFNKIMDKITEEAVKLPIPKTKEELFNNLITLFEKIVVPKEKASVIDRFTKIVVPKETYDKLRYFLIRERIGYGKLEPLLRDPYLEDIHVLGLGPIWVTHKIWGTMQTNLAFWDEKELNKYIIKMSELVERPVSDARPIVDAIMPDGSRVNFIYGKDISLKGSSFTIRKFTRKPISITQLIAWNTMPAEEAAYLWLCIEHGMNIFIIGETASGKTTTLNALTVFIRPDWKVYSVEDTPEVNIPHPVWQRTVTREAGKQTDVEMYDLLKAALRSRPNYIIVGEIRGREAYVAFQAMQCVKDAQIVLGDDTKSIKELFNEYKRKFGSKIINGKEIVEIKENLEIPAYDPDKGLIKARVKAILKMSRSKLIRVVLEDGNVFEVTPNHKFITNYGELTAKELLKYKNKEIKVLGFNDKLTKEKFIYIEDIKISGKSHTYDLLLDGAKYYIGFNGGRSIAIEDTGHPVLSTMHAGSVRQLIERLTGPPMNVPITFIDNLNVVVLQGTVFIKGNMERRVLSITEIERYIPEINRVATREVFVWDKIKDRHIFRGKYNSYILEYKIAPMMRLKDRRKIYEILELRKRILERMVEEKIFDFFEVWEVIRRFYEYGIEGLPFSL